jgi:hypothetical protein
VRDGSGGGERRGAVLKPESDVYEESQLDVV